MRIIIGKQNNFTYTFNSTAKTLTISGVLNFQITSQADTEGTLVEVYDVTTGADLNTTGATVVKTKVAGLPVYTVTLLNLQTGATGDTLLVFIEVSDAQAVYSILQYQKA